MTAFNRTSFNHATPMTEDEVRKYAPSVFATEPHYSRSDRFRAIPTWDVLKRVVAQGFAIVSARQQVVRVDDRKAFTKHFVRLRKTDEERKYQVNDTIFEIGMKNANDGSGAFDFMAGPFRVACLNGMICPLPGGESVRVRHTGNVIDKVIEGTFKVLSYAEHALAAPQDWSGIRLNSDERIALAESARVIRFGDSEGVVNTPIEARQLLIPRRVADQGTDLWTTFNVIQENVIKGGLSAYRRDEHGNARRATTRQVTGIDQDVKLNKALWVLAERMAELKQAA
jgi:hypothetical protein